MILHFISSGGQTLKTDFNKPPNVCLSVDISSFNSEELDITQYLYGIK